MRWPMRRSASGTTWANASERGSDLSLRFLVWCIRRLGDAPVKWLLGPIALYFCAFAPAVRFASREYQQQIDLFAGRPARRIGLRDIYRHIYVFADVLSDRFALWGGRHDKFKVELHGKANMEGLIAERRGAFLVGAHIGSFDMLRIVARDANIPVNVIMYTGNAEKINAAFEALDPDCNVRVIDLDPTSARAAFEIRACASRGEFVAILGDRAQLGGRTSRVGYASFLGRRAGFPQGPLLIAMALRLPVIMTVAVKTGPYAYDVHLETLATERHVPIRDRAAEAQKQIELYASHLERYCLRDPLQWFNFYPFWAGAEAGLESDAEPRNEANQDEHG